MRETAHTRLEQPPARCNREALVSAVVGGIDKGIFPVDRVRCVRRGPPMRYTTHMQHGAAQRCGCTRLWVRHVLYIGGIADDIMETPSLPKRCRFFKYVPTN